MSTDPSAPEDIAPGVSIGREDISGIEYIGSEKALIDGGYARPEWFAGLLRYRRTIVKTPSGEFRVIGEGKGNRLNNQHKENGAYSIGRNRDGSYSVFAYHHPDEYQRRKAIEHAKWKAKHEAREAEHAAKEQLESWLQAKEAHATGDYPNRWRNGVLYHLEQIEMLVTGRAVFTDFPDVGLPADEIATVSAAAAELRYALQSCNPKIKDRVQVSNVVSINAHAYRNMKRG